MRSHRFNLRRLLPAAVIGGAVLAFVAPAGATACTMVPMPMRELVRQADVIFTGTAIRADMPGFMTSSGDPVTWTFAIDAVEKGRVRERIRVMSAESEASCGYEFELGARYRVLATWHGDGLAVTGLGSGNEALSSLPDRINVEGEFYPVLVWMPLPLLFGLPLAIGLGLVLVLVLLVVRFARQAGPPGS